MQSVVRQGRGGFPGGRPPAGIGMAFAAIGLIGGGTILLQNSLFNVDGGHRAIKYKRISGVSKEIYSEGPSDASENLVLSVIIDSMSIRNPHHDPMVRDRHNI